MSVLHIVVPKLGFYHHYKHDPRKGVSDYAYEVLGVGFHTESDCRPEDAYTVIYRPLYEGAFVFRSTKQLMVVCVDVRPLDMWMGKVEKNGALVLRFTPVTDHIQIMNLKIIRDKMYEQFTA